MKIQPLLEFVDDGDEKFNPTNYNVVLIQFNRADNKGTVTFGTYPEGKFEAFGRDVEPGVHSGYTGDSNLIELIAMANAPHERLFRTGLSKALGIKDKTEVQIKQEQDQYHKVRLNSALKDIVRNPSQWTML